MLKKLLVSALGVALVSSVFAKDAKRIVSTAGSMSEVVVLLGKGNELVGVDTTSVSPADVMQKKPKIGYRRRLSAEGILSLRPDLIILAPDAGPSSVISQIESSGVDILRFKDNQTLEGIREDIALVADAIGAKKEGKKLITEIKKSENELKKLAKKHNPAIKASFLIGMGNGQLMALGKKSAGDKFLNLIELQNSFNQAGFKPVSEESLVASDAKVVLIAYHGDIKDGRIIYSINQNQPFYSALKNSRAGQNQCVYNVNLGEVLGFGINTAKYAKTVLKEIQHCLK